MTPITPCELLVDAGNVLGECVLWCERSRRVYWTDIEAGHLHCYCADTGMRAKWQMPERLASFALTDIEHVLLVGLASRLAFFNLRTNAMSTICEVEAALPMTRINDGRCDRQGRFVFGTMDERNHKEAIGSFYRLNRDLTLERLPLPRIAVANGICFSVDSNSMYFCDSMKKAIFRWDGYASSSTIPIKIFAELGAGSGAPDGATVDADGFVWSAEWGGARIVRYAGDGSVDRILHLPVSQPSCVCLGGTQLNRLFVTSARQSLSVAALNDEPMAGGLFHFQLDDVHGLFEVRFSGRILEIMETSC